MPFPPMNDYRGVDVSQAQGQRKSDSIKQKLALFTANPAPSQSIPMQARKSVDKPFVSLYERTLSLIAKLYNIPDFEYYLFPGGVSSLLQADSTPVIDPISILWGCFRLGAPLCHLLNQLQPKTMLPVPNVAGIVTYNNVCKKCIYDFIVGVKEELGISGSQIFSISEVYKDDTNGLVKVIGIVDLVLEEIEARGLAAKPKPFPFAMGQASVKPQDNRTKAIAELLNTERKYIESLNELMEYKNELEARHVISNDLVHKMFANLAELLDFQRRFLFSLEATLALPAEEQHIGAIFIQYEEGFQVYNAMCASYSNAIKLALENQEKLVGVGNIDPKALQGYLIQPVQRICRYPLMLKEIIKFSSPETYPYCEELKQAEAVMKRVTDQVNEVQRMEENKELKAKLMESIDDLQGLNANEWGDLLLADKFPMTAQDTEQIYGIYLFENLILCCKESQKDSSKPRRSKDSRSDTVTNDIKGKIYSTSISDVVDNSDPDNGIFELKVYWNDSEESFILKCRNIEQVELWRGRITACATGNTHSIHGRRSSDSSNSGPKRSSFRRTVQSINAFTRRGSQPEVDKRTASLPAMTRPTTKNGTHISPRGSSIYVSQYRKGESNQNHSQISSMSPSISKSMRNEIPLVNHHVRTSSHGPPRTQTPKPPSLSSLPPTASLPPPPTQKLSMIQSSAPARMVSPPPPSVPLPMPPQSTLPQTPPTIMHRRQNSSGQSQSASIRANHASAPLSKPPSTALPQPPSSALPQPPSQSASVKLHSSPALAPPRAPLPQPPVLSTQSGLPPAPPKSALPQPPVLASGPPKSALPVPPSASTSGSNPLTPPDEIPDSVEKLSISAPQNYSEPPKSALPSPPPRRPSAASTGGRVSAPGSSLIKMKTHYGELIFILAVPAYGAKFDDILDKVERKIRICGAAMPEGRRINLRYKDEEGDFVMLNSDEDIEMAFEMARNNNDKGSVTIQAE